MSDADETCPGCGSAACDAERCLCGRLECSVDYQQGRADELAAVATWINSGNFTLCVEVARIVGDGANWGAETEEQRAIWVSTATAVLYRLHEHIASGDHLKAETP